IPASISRGSHRNTVRSGASVPSSGIACTPLERYRLSRIIDPPAPARSSIAPPVPDPPVIRILRNSDSGRRCRESTDSHRRIHNRFFLRKRRTLFSLAVGSRLISSLVHPFREPDDRPSEIDQRDQIEHRRHPLAQNKNAPERALFAFIYRYPIGRCGHRADRITAWYSLWFISVSFRALSTARGRIAT